MDFFTGRCIPKPCVWISPPPPLQTGDSLPSGHTPARASAAPACGRGRPSSALLLPLLQPAGDPARKRQRQEGPSGSPKGKRRQDSIGLLAQNIFLVYVHNPKRCGGNGECRAGEQKDLPHRCANTCKHHFHLASGCTHFHTCWGA